MKQYKTLRLSNSTIIKNVRWPTYTKFKLKLLFIYSKIKVVSQTE